MREEGKMMTDRIVYLKTVTKKTSSDIMAYQALDENIRTALIERSGKTL